MQQQLFGTDPSNPRDLGALVWNACVLMARYTYQQLGENGRLKGCRILELGAGLGIVGIAAAQKGADVVMVEIEPALTTLRASVAHNGSPERGNLFSYSPHLPPEYFSEEHYSEYYSSLRSGCGGAYVGRPTLGLSQCLSSRC